MRIKMATVRDTALSPSGYELTKISRVQGRGQIVNDSENPSRW